LYLLWSLIGLGHTTVQIASYFILFHYIVQHDNKTAIGVLQQSVIKKRNRVNAISLTGLVMGWLMKVWFIILVGILSLIIDSYVLREVSTVLKQFEFYLVPLVQVHTSDPMKKFRLSAMQP
jgi:hypothetical protein